MPPLNQVVVLDVVEDDKGNRSGRIYHSSVGGSGAGDVVVAPVSERRVHIRFWLVNTQGGGATGTVGISNEKMTAISDGIPLVGPVTGTTAQSPDVSFDRCQIGDMIQQAWHAFA